MRWMLVALGLLWELPVGAARWDRIGPPGGRVRALVAAPGSPAVLYAGGAAVYRSADAGQHWVRCADVFTSRLPSDAPPLVTALAVSPADADRVLVASPQGLFLTTDAGATWRRAGGVTANVSAIAFSADGRFAWASAGGMVYRSADAGGAWAAAPAPAMAALCADPLGGAFGALSTPDAQGRSLCHSDDGVYWSVLLAPAMAISVLRTSAAGDALYAASPSGLHRVARGSWAASFLLALPPSAIEADAKTGLLFAAVNAADWDDGVYRSTDDGASWAKLNAGISWRGPLALAVCPGGVPVAGTERSGVMTLDASETWRPSNDGLDMACALGVAQTAGAVLAALPDGLWRTEDSGAHWVQTHVATTSSVLCASPVRPNRVYYTKSTGLVRSDDGGKAWGAFSAGLPSGAVVVAMAADPSRAETVYATLASGAVYRSTTTSAAWKALLPAWPSAPAGAPAFVAAASTPTTLYAVRPDGLRRSTDDGATWAWRSECPVDARLCVDPTDPNTVYRAISSGGTVGLERSTDGGATWSTVYEERGAANSGFAATFVAADARTPGRLLLGTNRGLRVRDGSGAAWRSEPAAMFCISWAPGGGTGDLLGTDGAGVLCGRPSAATAADAVRILALAGCGSAPTAEQLAWGDMNGDGRLTPLDADEVLQAALGP